MDIKKIIFSIVESNAHNWVRYYKIKELQGFTYPGEYILIRSSFITSNELDILFENGFKIDKIQSKRIDQDSYSDILFKRDLNLADNDNTINNHEHK